MAQSRAESTRDTYNYGQYLNQSPPNTIKVIREFERIQKKICRHKMSIMFNEICINEEMLPKYTYFKLHDPAAHKYNSTLEYRRDLVKRQITLCKNNINTLNLDIPFAIYPPLMMAQSRAESTRDTYNYGQYINQLPPNTIKVIREFERIQKKICRHKMSIMFNECIYMYVRVCMSAWVYICMCVYVYAYVCVYICIYVCVFVCTCMCVCMCLCVMYTCMCVYVCICMCVCMCLCGMYVHVYVRVSMVCMWASACMRVCVCVCVFCFYIFFSLRLCEIYTLKQQRHWGANEYNVFIWAFWVCFVISQVVDCPVGWGCRIHRLLLCRGVRPPPNECPGYDNKQSDGDVPAVLELWEMRSTRSTLARSGSTW